MTDEKKLQVCGHICDLEAQILGIQHELNKCPKVVKEFQMIARLFEVLVDDFDDLCGELQSDYLEGVLLNSVG